MLCCWFWNQVELSCFALLGDHVPAAARARMTAWVSSGVAGSERGPRNLAAMMTRRSLTVMSSKDGSVLVRYHGERARRSAATFGGWPAVAYQTVTSDRQIMPNG